MFIAGAAAGVVFGRGLLPSPKPETLRASESAALSFLAESTGFVSVDARAGQVPFAEGVPEYEDEYGLDDEGQALLDAEEPRGNTIGGTAAATPRSREELAAMRTAAALARQLEAQGEESQV